MACSCSKNKQRSAKTTSSVVKKVSRPLSEGGRIRRAEKRMIR